MTTETLSKQEIIGLRARAHHLHPVVMVGPKGLTEAVIRETNTALAAHELIKVSVADDDRSERALVYKSLCLAVGAQPVQHIGKLLVLYRKRSEQK